MVADFFKNYLEYNLTPPQWRKKKWHSESKQLPDQGIKNRVIFTRLSRFENAHVQAKNFALIAFHATAAFILLCQDDHRAYSILWDSVLSFTIQIFCYSAIGGCLTTFLCITLSRWAAKKGKWHFLFWDPPGKAESCVQMGWESKRSLCAMGCSETGMWTEWPGCFFFRPPNRRA